MGFWQNATGFLQYLDISVGQEVATLATRGGRLSVMAQNAANAVVHLGHSNGKNPKKPQIRVPVTLTSP